MDPDPDDRRERDADGGGSVAPHEDRVAAREDPRHLQREARAAETLLPRKTGKSRDEDPLPVCTGIRFLRNSPECAHN